MFRDLSTGAPLSNSMSATSHNNTSSPLAAPGSLQHTQSTDLYNAQGQPMPNLICLSGSMPSTDRTSDNVHERYAFYPSHLGPLQQNSQDVILNEGGPMNYPEYPTPGIFNQIAPMASIHMGAPAIPQQAHNQIIPSMMVNDQMYPFVLKLVLPRRADKWFTAFRESCRQGTKLQQLSTNSNSVDTAQQTIWEFKSDSIHNLIQSIELLVLGIPKLNVPPQCIGRTTIKKVSYRLLIPSKLAYRIIGVRGQTIQMMRDSINCDIFVSQTTCRDTRILCLVSKNQPPGHICMNSALRLVAYASRLVNATSGLEFIYKDAEDTLESVENKMFKVIAKTREEQESMDASTITSRTNSNSYNQSNEMSASLSSGESMEVNNRRFPDRSNSINFQPQSIIHPNYSRMNSGGQPTGSPAQMSNNIFGLNSINSASSFGNPMLARVNSGLYYRSSSIPEFANFWQSNSFGTRSFELLTKNPSLPELNKSMSIDTNAPMTQDNLWFGFDPVISRTT